MNSRLKIFASLMMAWILTTAFLHAQAPKSQDEDPDFVEARRLFWAGQYREADTRFREYLLVHPNHEVSQNFLRMIAQSKRFDPEKIKQTKARLESIRVPKLSLKKAGWKETLNYLQQLANAPKDGKPPANLVNFIPMLSSNFTVEITLDLNDISLLEAIEAVCKTAGLRCVVDTWAVIIDLPKGK